MGTASAMHRQASLLHTRGTWILRDDRTLFAVCLGVIWVGMISGFGLDFPSYLHQLRPVPLAMHVHAVVFSIWMLIVTAQVVLVMKDRVRWHMKMGWFALGWACLMLVVAPWAVMSWMAVNLQSMQHPPLPPPILPSQFLAINIADLTCFAALLAWGFTLRKNPAAHKRMMILATVALADPGFARLSKHLIARNTTSPFEFFCFVFYGNVMLVAMIAIWDLWKGRLMRQFVVGAAGMLACFGGASILFFWSPWHAATLGWVEAWKRTFG
ncbi:MAG TPA: hypothetical protein VFU68_05515 [Terracidiphilus sp.]|nr:hypothetical protein [Terracidiphilus sp.]